ncbi:MAG: hypothetical protein ABSF44_13300 [Candidatus Bathyarchaeia archaeon]|jgi:hypothetical protein
MSVDSPFLFCNIFQPENAKGIHSLAQNIFVVKSFATTASAVLAFPNISVTRTMSTFGGGQYVSTINTVDRQLFDGFEHVTGAVGLSLADKSQTPRVIAKLKKLGLIDDDLCFKTLDSLLTFDGLLSQVNQDGKLLAGDFDLIRNILTLFSRIKLNLSQKGVLAEYCEYRTESNYFWLIGITGTSFNYLNYLASTFSTSSSTLTQSSNVDFMKSSG